MRSLTLPVRGARPSDGLVHDPARYLGQLAMLPLAQRTQPLEGLMLGNAGRTHQDTESSVDNTAESRADCPSTMAAIRASVGCCGGRHGVSPSGELA